MKIPKIIHQTWNYKKIPSTREFEFASWRKHHSDWNFKFWDDSALAEFIATEFPHYLDLYHSYKLQIERVYMARYLILKKQGGVFVDLDMECVKPIEPLLAEWTMLVGVEPPSHAEHPAAVRRGMKQIVGTAFLASIPNHPFWDHLIGQLPRSSPLYDPLETAGPIFLTDAIASWPIKDQIAVAGALLLYPFDRAQAWSGETFEIERWELLTRESFAIHHWEGSWLLRGSKPTRNVAQIKGRLLSKNFSIEPPRPAPSVGTFPLISCLMVTRDRANLAKSAIQCFQNQTYSNRELIIVEHAPKSELLAEYVQMLDDPRIRLFRVASEETTLGEVRNYSAQCANGDYISIWDDDDLSDPLRLELQYLLLQRGGAHACVLSRYMEWWPMERKLSISEERAWESTLLCEKSALPNYPALQRQSDTPMMERLLRDTRVVYLDIPRLYLYVFHGNNLWQEELATLHWELSHARYTGEAYERVTSELSKRLPMQTYPVSRSIAESEKLRNDVDLQSSILNVEITA